jgi:hypothetical protein
MSEQAVQGLGCPRCGGIVQIPEGQILVNCPYCDQRSVVGGDRGFQRYQVPGRIERAQAEQSARDFMSSSAQIASGLKNKAQITEIFLVHLPFWSAWGRGVAWGFGQVEVGSGDDKHYEAREKKVLKDLTWNGVACDVGEFGVRKISLQGRPLEPFNGDQLHQTGMVFEPVGSDEEALENARSAFEEAVRDEVKMDRQAQLFTRILSPRLGVVYYPVWVVRYVFRERSFQVVVDGFDGKVLYGKAPGNLLMRALSLVAGMAVGAFLAIDVPAFILSATSDSSNDNPLAIVAIAFVGGLALMAGGYQRFRHGEHYEFNRYKGKDGGSDIQIAGVDISKTIKDFVK